MTAPDRIRREGVEYVRADQWQPIETAPRDGAEILGYHQSLGVWIVSWDSDEEGFSPGFQPTHWMPLPEPPKETEND